jgi:hypothetical protein
VTNPIRLVRQLPKVPQWPADDFLSDDGIDPARWTKYMRDQNAGMVEWYREYQEGLNRALNLPNFYVDRNGTNQTAIITATTTKIQFTNVSSGNACDDWGYFDSATNYRYTPLISGMYVFAVQVRFVAVLALTSVLANVFKNGAVLNTARSIAPGATSPTALCVTTTRMDGKSDYIEFFATQDSGVNQDINGGVSASFAYGFKFCD